MLMKVRREGLECGVISSKAVNVHNVYITGCHRNEEDG